MNRILLVDDDMALCRLLKDLMQQEGYEVSLCHDGRSGLRELTRADYQMVVLDIMLPVLNGFEVLTEIRKHSHVPVLMLTAKDSEGDKVCGLRMGADDYLTKPFSNSEFLARVSSLLRRYLEYGQELETESCVTMGEIEINSIKHEVRKGTRKIDLTAKEFELLLFFARNQERVFTKRQIYNAVWKEEYAFDENNIMVHIRRLRKKIEDHPETPSYILTVRGVGYKAGGGDRDDGD